MKKFLFIILIVFLLPSISFCSDLSLPIKCSSVINIFNGVSKEGLSHCIGALVNDQNELDMKINESLKKIDKVNDELLPRKIDMLHVSQDNLKYKLNDTLLEIESLKEKINKLEYEVRSLKEKTKRKGENHGKY
jgi:peptidoglycan hydrolase CwlO-like protein